MISCCQIPRTGYNDDVTTGTCRNANPGLEPFSFSQIGNLAVERKLGTNNQGESMKAKTNVKAGMVGVPEPEEPKHRN